jgi:Flp pilus assembly protein TadD
MVSVVILMVIGLGISGIIWMRRRRRQAYAPSDLPGVIPHETLVLQAFAHGNTCLAAGQFAEAIAAFYQARELKPDHPHVAGRLAEVERQQQAARAPRLVGATV